LERIDRGMARIGRMERSGHGDDGDFEAAIARVVFLGLGHDRVGIAACDHQHVLKGERSLVATEALQGDGAGRAPALQGEAARQHGHPPALSIPGVCGVLCRRPIFLVWCLLGAGGAGSAIAYEALRQGVTRLLIVDADASRARALSERMNFLHEGGRAIAVAEVAAAMKGAKGLIHATPTGMDKLPGLPLPAPLLRPGLWVSEVVYFPLETELLKSARQIGCATADGGHMNVGQAVRGFKLFTGREADATRMDYHFRRLARM